MHLIQFLKNEFCFDLPMFSKYPSTSINSYFYKMTLWVFLDVRKFENYRIEDGQFHGFSSFSIGSFHRNILHFQHQTHIFLLLVLDVFILLECVINTRKYNIGTYLNNVWSQWLWTFIKLYSHKNYHQNYELSYFFPS